MSADMPYLPGEGWKFRMKGGMNWGGLILSCASDFVEVRDTQTGKVVRVYFNDLSFAEKLPGAIGPNQKVAGV